MVTSTPEGSLEALHDSDISIILPQPPGPILVFDSSAEDLDLILETCISHQQLCSRDCDVHEQPTMRLETSDQSLTSQNQSSQRNNKHRTLEQLVKEKVRSNLDALEDLERSGSNPDTLKLNANRLKKSDRKRNKSIISDQSQTSQNQSSQRNKGMEQTLEQLVKDNIKRNMDTLDDLNTSDNKSKTSERKHNKSVASENRPVLCDNKTSTNTLNKSVKSQVESSLETTNINASMPQRVRKSDCCDFSQEEMYSLQSQICDCGSAKDTAGVQKTEKAQKIVKLEEELEEISPLQTQICDCGSAKDCAKVQQSGKAQKTVKVEEDVSFLKPKTCDCGNVKDTAGVQKTGEAQKSVKIEGEMSSLKIQICDCGSTNKSAGLQKRDITRNNVKVEETSLGEHAELNLKPCPCTKRECMHKEETRVQAKEENSDGVATSDNKMSIVSQDSGGGSSCAGVCEQYYRNKLLATLQILENKEETIRVQGSSLGVAEARIAALTERACALRCELDQKARELNKLRKFAESCRVEKADISITAEMQEVENQKDIVNTLQDNLSVIAELYRECFFETAKQEELIEMLRKSYLDVRLMDKDKSDKINRLQNVINTQKWSIEQCQDVVIEVENLKSEISNFLNSSNNDSGMWERGSESPDVGEELGDILDQLRQLQDLLTGDCTCGLEDENRALRTKNQHLGEQVDKLRHRVKELEGTVASSHSLGQQYQRQIEEKEQEFHEVRKRLVEFESANKERGATCETLARQLQQSQVLLEDKIAELAEAQRARAAQELAVTALKQELEQADAVIKEGLRKLMEASQWRGQLEQSQARVEELERQLQTVCAQCRDLENCCREKERNASELQGQLEEAHARGAALCDESRRVTACVRQWMRRQRALAREQQEKIKMQESMLSELQRCVEARQNHSVRTSQSEVEPCCSKSSPRLHPCASGTTYTCPTTHLSVGGSETAFSRCGPIPCSVDREREMPCCSKCANRQDRRERSSESEMASCSSAPVPPRRRKKLPPCGDTHCPWSPNSPHIRFASLPRQISPTDEIIEHVEHLHAALAATQRRWARPRR